MAIASSSTRLRRAELDRVGGEQRVAVIAMFSRTNSLTLIPVHEYRCAHRDARADDAGDFRARCEGRFATSIYSTLGIVVADRLVTPVGSLFSLGFGQPTGHTPQGGNDEALLRTGVRRPETPSKISG